LNPRPTIPGQISVVLFPLLPGYPGRTDAQTNGRIPVQLDALRASVRSDLDPTVNLDG
jgi:hypothetical protein